MQYHKILECSWNKYITGILLLFLILSSTVNAQTALIKSLNDNLLKVDSSQKANDTRVFAYMAPSWSTNKIVALGEETHGIKEFADFRGGIIKYLVTHLNYKVIVLEADFFGTQTLNNYIQNGKGNKYYALLSTGMGIYSNPEFLSIVEWLRLYNSNKSQEKKVSIYGCDMQKSAAIAYLFTGNLKLSKELSTTAKEGLKILLGPKDYEVNGTEKKKLDQLTTEIRQELSVLKDTTILARSLKTILQYDELYQKKYNYDRSKIRDKYMAENVVWINKHEANKEMILLAHNDHIAKSPIGIDIKRMGNYLKEIYKKKYYVLGMSFYMVTLSAINKKTSQPAVFSMPEIEDSETSEFIFSQCRVPNFLLDFTKANKDIELANFLSKKIYSKHIGSDYNSSQTERNRSFMPLNDKFDGVVFFRNILPLPFKWDKR